MTDKQREIAETVFERSVRREAEINDALKQEHACREAKHVPLEGTAIGTRTKEGPIVCPNEVPTR